MYWYWWAWIAIIVFLVLLPLGYGWGYRGWGPPPYRDRRSGRRVPLRSPRGEFGEPVPDGGWGPVGVGLLWLAALIAIAWFVVAVA